MLGDTKHWRFGAGGDLADPGPRAQRRRVPAHLRSRDPVLLGPVPRGQAERAPAQLAVQLATCTGSRPSSRGSPTTASRPTATPSSPTTGRWAGTPTSIRAGGRSTRCAAAARCAPIPACSGLRQPHHRYPRAAVVQHQRLRRPQLDLGRARRRDRPRRDDPGAVQHRRVRRAEHLPTATSRCSTSTRSPTTSRRTTSTSCSAGSTRPTPSMTLRANWTFSPHLSLQAYAAAVHRARATTASSRRSTTPAPMRYADRFHLFTSDELQLGDGTYHVARGAASYSFDRAGLQLPAAALDRGRCAGSTGRARRCSRSGATAGPAMRSTTAGSASATTPRSSRRRAAKTS